MKIFYLVDQYPSEDGSSSVFIHNQIKVIKKRSNYDVFVLKLDLRSIRKKRKYFFSYEKFDDVDILTLSIPLSPFNFLINFLTPILGIHLLKKAIIKFGKPDLVHAHFLMGGYIGSKIKKKFNIPCVLTEHSSCVLKQNQTKLISKLMGKIYPNYDCLISVSNVLEKSIDDSGYICNQIIPNTIQNYFLEPKFVEKEKEFTFIFVGHLINSKGIINLLKGFNIFINTCFSNAKLIIVGNGVLLNDVIKFIGENNLSSKIDFFKNIKNIDLPLYYLKSHVFVLPSIYETFGVVYIEAMACGLPILTLKNGGSNNIVNNNNGHFIIDNAPITICNGLKYMYDNYHLYNENEIRSEFIEKYSEEVFFKKINVIYEKLIK